MITEGSGVSNNMAYVDRAYNEMMLSVDYGKKFPQICGACGLPVDEHDGCMYGIVVVERNFIAYEPPRKWMFHKSCTPKLEAKIRERVII